MTDESRAKGADAPVKPVKDAAMEPKGEAAATMPASPGGNPGETAEARPASQPSPQTAAQPAPKPVAKPAGKPTPPARAGRPGGPAARGGGKRPGKARGQKLAARPRFRHFLLLLSFLALVIAPTAYVNWYLHERAADQYASRLAFTIQSDEGQVVSVLEGFLGGGSGGSSADQAEVLYGFIQSQNMVETLQERLDLRAIYNKRPEDWYFSLGDTPSIEELVDYWQAVCIVSFSAGIVEVEVRAFDPQDARLLAGAVLDESTAQINRMSAEARDDALRDATSYLEEKERIWRDARLALDTARSEDAMIDPGAEAKAALERIAKLEAELDIERIKLDELLEFAPTGDSRIVTVQRRIDTLNGLIAEERRKIASTGGGTLSQSVGKFEALAIEAEIAQTAYTAALASYENARIEARRKQSYLSAHISPTLSETPEYPQRYLLGGLVFVTLFLGWIVLVMLAYNIKDRR